MSLINNVLNELEKNKRKASDEQQAVLTSVIPTIKKQKGMAGWKLIYWLMILAIAFGVTWHYRPHLAILKEKIFVKLAHKNKTLAAIKVQPKSATPIAPKPQPPASAIKLQNIALEQKDNKTILDFILSAPTTYYVEHSSEQQFSLTLNNTDIAGNLPIALENSFIISFATKQNNNNIVSSITLLPNTKIETLQLINQPTPHLHLVFSNPQLSKSTLAKTPVPLPPEEEIIDRYQDIQQLLAQNKISNTIQKLHLFIGDFPDHNQARLLLASLLIKDGRLQKADDVLMAGLNKYGSYLPFIKLKAHILIKQNKDQAAIDLLQKNITMAANDEEYLALLAALYQQQESFMLAAETYNQLTKIQPEQPSWWLGLGIALESAGKMNAAREAYQRAYNSSDASSELGTFLYNKIK